MCRCEGLFWFGLGIGIVGQQSTVHRSHRSIASVIPRKRRYCYRRSEERTRIDQETEPSGKRKEKEVMIRPAEGRNQASQVSTPKRHESSLRSRGQSTGPPRTLPPHA